MNIFRCWKTTFKKEVIIVFLLEKQSFESEVSTCQNNRFCFNQVFDLTFYKHILDYLKLKLSSYLINIINIRKQSF